MEAFVKTWAAAREKAAALGVKMRPVSDAEAVKAAQRCLDSHRESDGFWALADKGRLDLSLEALAVKKQFTDLFTDDQANTALTRLMDAGYTFR